MFSELIKLFQKLFQIGGNSIGIFDNLIFDFNGDGKEDDFEIFAGLQMMAGSRREAIDLTGDDSFYMGCDTLEDELDDELDDLDDELDSDFDDDF